jgi:hypothetical protein
VLDSGAVRAVLDSGAVRGSEAEAVVVLAPALDREAVGEKVARLATASPVRPCSHD